MTFKKFLGGASEPSTERIGAERVGREELGAAVRPRRRGLVPLPGGRSRALGAGHLGVRHHAADKVRRGHRVLVTRPVEAAGRDVEAEDTEAVGVLVRRDEPLPGAVELEVPRRGAPRVLDRRHGEQPLVRPPPVDPEHGDAVVPPVGHQDKIARRVHGDAAAGVQVARESLWDGADGLHQPQGRCAPGRQPGASLYHRLGRPVVELEDGHVRGELVDHVAVRERRVELDVPGAEGPPPLGAGEDRAAGRQRPVLRVVPELADDVHAEVRHVGDLAEEGVQDHGVRVRVRLALRLRRGVVDGVVHVLVAARLHGPALVRVEEGAELGDAAALPVQSEDPDGRVPVVHDEHVLAGLVQGDVARRGASRVDAPELLHLAARGAHAPRVDLAVLRHRLRAGVQDVPVRVEAGEGRVHAGLIGDGEQRHLPVGGVHQVRVEAVLRLLPPGPVGEVVEACVAGHDDELLLGLHPGSLMLRSGWLQRRLVRLGLGFH
eukprot:CAMPEP_0179307826 /NCGR_PEP_ID=MMETSP0797-20121207/50838_1 /TAXON_ID=47934 /ORGANISM="Dinophysis acuminata, Strain DAEP01" /LENGTH=490 /DNA_ID=CAMNT_0021017515 /DNA_START=245 /DNA_END=1718 /DNA_ORIENTATION=+